MKRYAALVLLLLALFLLPLCALAAEGDPENVVAVGEYGSVTGFNKPYYTRSVEILTPGIIAVEEDSILGLSPGLGLMRVTWTLSGYPTITEDFQIKVNPAPTGITLNETSIKLGTNERFTIQAILPEGTSGRVIFTYNNVSWQKTEKMSMEVYAASPRVGSVTATTFNGHSATCQVEVVEGIERVDITPASLKLFEGQTYALSYEVKKGYARSGVTFKSDDTNVCTVTSDGVVTAVSPGSTWVDCRSYQSFGGQECYVTVYDEPDAIDLSGIKSRLGVGGEVQFTPKDSSGNPLSLDLSFSDPTVLNFDSGKVKALKEGTCTVTASSALLSASMEITVCPAPLSFALDPASVSLKELETASLTPVLPDGTEATFTYQSDHPEIASVSQDGVVKALKPGSASIRAQSHNGKTAYCTVTVVPSEITYTLSPANARLGTGETLQLSLTDAGGNIIPAAYASDHPNTAAVDASGLVSGLRYGHAYITATVADGRTYTADINVYAVPSYITVSPQEMYLIQGDGEYFSVDSDMGSIFEYTAASSDTGVAKVTGHHISAVGQGTAIVTVTSFNGKTAEIYVEVYPPIGPLIPRVGYITVLGVGQSKSMDVRDMYNKPIPCTYTTSERTSAKVSAKGTITGVGGNSASLITATARDGRTCEVVVLVYSAPKYLRLDTSAVRLPFNERWQLIPQVQEGSIPVDITFTSSRTFVATVSADGVITAKNAGTCVITAKTYNGKKAKVTVTVGNRPAFVVLTPNVLYLGRGESRSLNVLLSPGAAGTHTLVSGDTGVATVTDSGTVTGVENGTAVITVTTYNDKTDTCTVHVLNAPQSLWMESPYSVIGIKQPVQMQLGMTSGSSSHITYVSSNPKVATVSGGGKVTGVKAGSVTITASTYNGLTASVTLQVKKAPSSIKLSTNSLKLGLGETLKLNAALSSGSEGTYEYRSSNASVATVDQTGLVTTHATGRATITVQTYNGKKATCSVSVYALPAAISVKSVYTLKPGKSFSLPVSYPKNTYGRVTYASDNPDVATVDASGKVRGITPGTATITVTANGGAKATCAVTVK